MASVTFEDVTKRFDGDVTAVDDLDLDRRRRRVHGPARPVGLRQDHGPADDRRPRGHHRRASCRIGDRVVNDVEPAKRDISMVFQSYALYPHMTVRQEHRVAAARPPATPSTGPTSRPASSPGPSATSGSTRRPASSTSSAYLDRKPAALSGGQRQRVALARAIVGRPAGLPHGRAAVEPRRQAAGRRPALELVDLHRRVRHHLRLRHPRPGRGHDDGRPHRGHVGRPPPAGRHARRRSTRPRPTCSWPSSSARRP